MRGSIFPSSAPLRGHLPPQGEGLERSDKLKFEIPKQAPPAPGRGAGGCTFLGNKKPEKNSPEKSKNAIDNWMNLVYNDFPYCDNMPQKAILPNMDILPQEMAAVKQELKNALF